METVAVLVFPLKVNTGAGFYHNQIWLHKQYMSISTSRFLLLLVKEWLEKWMDNDKRSAVSNADHFNGRKRKRKLCTARLAFTHRSGTLENYEPLEEKERRQWWKLANKWRMNSHHHVLHLHT
jgi:CRISPR/Cas system-associated endonuclease Cas1